MSRQLRFIPDGGALVEVTCRTLHSRFLLRPSRKLDEIIVGVLGRAQRLYGVRICGYMFASSHYHLLLDVDNARQLSQPKTCQVPTSAAARVSAMRVLLAPVRLQEIPCFHVSSGTPCRAGRLASEELELGVQDLTKSSRLTGGLPQNGGWNVEPRAGRMTELTLYHVKYSDNLAEVINWFSPVVAHLIASDRKVLGLP